MNTVSTNEFLDSMVDQFQNPAPGSQADKDPAHKDDVLTKLRLLTDSFRETLGEEKMAQPVGFGIDNLPKIVNDFLEGRATIASSRERVEKLLKE